MRDTTAPNIAHIHSDRANSLAPKEESRGLKGWLAGKYNRFYRAVARKEPVPATSQDLFDIRQRARFAGDIDEHLETMFTEALLLQPKLIVELGVRGGMSTFVFERVARLYGGAIVSVDLEDCSRVVNYPAWHFVKGDDVEFASQFAEFCRARGLPAAIDLLFIDTSHYYEHTKQEINAWFPLLSPNAKVMLHDTNLNPIGPRRDGSIQLSWDNERGVVRALEEYLGIHIPEHTHFTDLIDGWLLRHWPNCNGFTILDRINQS